MKKLLFKLTVGILTVFVSLFFHISVVRSASTPAASPELTKELQDESAYTVWCSQTKGPSCTDGSAIEASPFCKDNPTNNLCGGAGSPNSTPSPELTKELQDENAYTAWCQKYKASSCTDGSPIGLSAFCWETQNNNLCGEVDTTKNTPSPELTKELQDESAYTAWCQKTKDKSCTDGSAIATSRFCSGNLANNLCGGDSVQTNNSLCVDGKITGTNQPCTPAGSSGPTNASTNGGSTYGQYQTQAQKYDNTVTIDPNSVTAKLQQDTTFTNGIVSCGREITNDTDPSKRAFAARIAATSCDFQAFVLYIQRLINYLIILGVMLTAVAFVWSGWEYLNARDKPGSLSKVRERVLGIVIGMLILLGSWLLFKTATNWLLGCDTDTNQNGYCSYIYLV